MASKEERQEAHERSSPTGAVVYEAIKKEGEEELDRSTTALAWSGLAAGLSMGFSFVGEALLRHGLPDRPWRALVAKLGYSLGFLIVVLGRQQLFTENTLTVILPLLRRRDSITLRNVLRLWATVFAANMVGAWLFAIAAAHTAAFTPDMRATFAAIGREALEPSAAAMLIRGIYAGWLIALMVWLLPFAEAARVWVIIILTYIVGVAQFSHIIAGATETGYMVAIGERSIVEWAGRWMVPTLAGNVIGGVSLVAALAHAQFVAAVHPQDL